MNISVFKTRWILILTGWIMFVMENFFEPFPSCLFFWLAGLYIIGNSLVFCMLVLSGDSFFSSYIPVTTRISRNALRSAFGHFYPTS